MQLLRVFLIHYKWLKVRRSWIIEVISNVWFSGCGHWSANLCNEVRKWLRLGSLKSLLVPYILDFWPPMEDQTCLCRIPSLFWIHVWCRRVLSFMLFNSIILDIWFYVDLLSQWIHKYLLLIFQNSCKKQHVMHSYFDSLHASTFCITLNPWFINYFFFLALQFCIGTIRDDFLGVINDPGAAS